MKAYSQILLTILAAAAGFAVMRGAGSSSAPITTSRRACRRPPSCAKSRSQVPLQVYSRDGRLIDEFGEQKRTPVDYEDIPPLLVKAVLAAEDEHFFEHPGIDYRGIIRGALNELRSGGGNVGGSTITQQVPRTLTS